jgi:hypothetical protein
MMGADASGQSVVVVWICIGDFAGAGASILAMHGDFVSLGLRA